MRLYKPVFDSKWKIDSFDSNDVRILYISNTTGNKGICRWKERVGFYGPIYEDKNIFTSEEDAWRWINKDYSVLENIYTDFKRVGE